MNILNSVLLAIINAINAVIPNYGLAIIVFTLLIKLCVLPLDLKSRRSMQRMAKINPMMEAIKQKYGADQEKYNQKIQELYKKEKISPLSGCLPMLISMPILFAMFYAMRVVANEQLVRQFLTFMADPTMDPLSMNESFLWIKNLWMPDTPFHTYMPDLASLQMIEADIWNRVSAQLVNEGVLTQALSLTKDTLGAYINETVVPFLNSPEYAVYLKPVPGLSNINMIFFSFSIYQNFNGLYILPILAIVTQILSQKMTTAQQGTQASQTQNQNMMLWIFSFMSLWFCTTSSGAFSIYWVFSNIYMMVQQIVFAKYFAWQDRKSATAQEVGIR
jgi:YidC/Oxa1 family membrane protein insertase